MPATDAGDLLDADPAGTYTEDDRGNWHAVGPPDYGDYLDDPPAHVETLLPGPVTPAEAAAAGILRMFGGHAGAAHPDGMIPISFGTVTDAAAWACATGMTRRALMRDPVTSFTAPVVVLLRAS